MAAALAQIGSSIQIVSVGIGSGINQSELNQIGRNGVISVNTFDALNDIVNLLSLEACTSSAPVSVGQNVQNTLGQSQTQNVKYMGIFSFSHRGNTPSQQLL